MGWTDLLDENDKVVGIVGDSGWDLAGTFVELMIDLYKREFNRKPTQSEVICTVEFVIGYLPEKLE